MEVEILRGMQEKYIKINNLKVSEKLSDFVTDELLKDTNVSAKKLPAVDGK